MRFYKHLAGLLAVTAGFVGSTFAGTLTNVSITGSDLSPGATSDYTFTYTVETTVPADQWAFCISGNPWGSPMDIFQHSISISVDGTPATIDSSGIFGSVGLGGAYCRSVNITVNSGSTVSATINGLVNPVAASYGVWLLTYNFEFLGSSYVIDGLSGDTTLIKIGNPIASCDDLANINNDLTKDYTLTEDLDCSGSGNSIMIGTNMSPFVGHFDGGNHSITVAFNTGYSGTYGGLFRYVFAGGSIKNLTVLGTVHLDATEVGGIVGKAWLANLENVHFSGNIIVGENQISIGGIAGRLEDSTLSGSSAHGTVQALLNSSTVGGLVGLFTQDAIIKYSYADNDVSGYYNVGGLVGEGYGSSIIENSYAAGDVESRAIHGGGIIGYADQTFVNDSYALGDVYATDNAGGIAGTTRGLYVTNAYAVGSVYTGASAAGGLLGGIEGGMGALPNEVSGYFWDVDTSHMPGYFSFSTGSLDGTIGLTTLQMHNIENYLNAGWDFTGTWDISSAWNNWYPFLQWQTFDTPRGSESSIYMNDGGATIPGSSTHSYTMEWTNSSDSDLSDVVLTLYGDVHMTGFQQASGGNLPTFSGIVDGSYIQWIIPSLLKNETGGMGFLITQPSDGTYVYTATIAAPYNTEYYTGNNSFTVTSTVDTVTEVPQIIAPLASSSHQRGQAMSISFVLPELLSSHSLHLYFVPNATGQQMIDLQLMDANALVTNTFNIIPAGNLLNVTEVVSGNATSIPNGTYTVVITYQDVYGNPTASSSVSNVIITDNISNGGGGAGGGGGSATPDYCPNGDMSSSFYDDSCGNASEAWKTFFAQVSSGGISSVSGTVITVKAFVTDVFKLLHITKPIHRQADSDTKTVPDKLVIKVIAILKKLLKL